MKIAIIGSGISGLTAAFKLNKHHDICLYEAADRLGGHTATKHVKVNNKDFNIDTGFIVFNDWTYPNFIKLMEELGVESQPATMGFSVFNPADGFEYAGTNLTTLFAQKRNLFSLKHWRMLKDIVRFNKEALQDLKAGNLSPNETLGEYLLRKKYSTGFIERYLIPMGSAIWSATQGAMLNFPLAFFIRFFENHGLLNVVNRPQWRVIKGGSKNYIDPLIASFKYNIKLNSSVDAIVRKDSGVSITANGITEHYDHVVLACHSDQALAALSDPTADEIKILQAIQYQNNSVVLHTDTRLLPRRKSTRSSWNYLLQSNKQQSLPILTYSMNILQSIESDIEFCVTLNADDYIDPQKILGKYQYAHPVFTQEAIHAQQQWQTINGVNNTWFCGAYWFNGFHEDGVNSALRVATALGVEQQ
ncbi:MAG: FAD-dependent oxidoreductase [Pseudomonadota bacterium]